RHRRRIPSQSARCAYGHGFAAGEEPNRFRAENRPSAIEHAMCESSEVGGGGKNSGMRRNPAQHAGIFVLHFALNNSFPKSSIVLRRRNLYANLRRRIESRIRHRKRREDLALAEAVERFVSQPFESDAENDEANVAILGAASWIVGQRRSQGDVEKLITGVRFQK